MNVLGESIWSILGSSEKLVCFLQQVCFFFFLTDVDNLSECSTLLKVWRTSKLPGSRERGEDLPVTLSFYIRTIEVKSLQLVRLRQHQGFLVSVPECASQCLQGCIALETVIPHAADGL